MSCLPRFVATIGETMDVILRAARQVIKPELVLDPPEPEVYLLAGKKLLVATIPSTVGPVYQAGGIFWIRQGGNANAGIEYGRIV
jgi:hypothetical protein